MYIFFRPVLGILNNDEALTSQSAAKLSICEQVMKRIIGDEEYLNVSFKSNQGIIHPITS